MYSDFHLHTSFSSDSDTAPELQIEKAISYGMKSICITDHQDFDVPDGDLDFLFDTDDYFKKLTALREIYGDRIDLKIGVELGLQPHLGSSLPEYIASYPFDFVIGSTHFSRGMDPYYPKFFEGVEEAEAYRLYFEEELENLKKYDCFDVAGHIDYVVRYGPTRNENYTYQMYEDVLEEILKTIIEKGKGLECNTNGLRAGLGEPNPSLAILKRSREMGGEILTIGSDGHTPEHMGYAFDRIGEMLKSCGFKYYATFTGRKPEFHLL